MSLKAAKQRVCGIYCQTKICVVDNILIEKLCVVYSHGESCVVYCQRESMRVRGDYSHKEGVLGYILIEILQ